MGPVKRSRRYLSLCRTCCSAPSLLAENIVRRPADCIGSNWHKAGDGRDAQIASYLAAVEGPFEIRVSRAGYRCFAGLLDAALPDDTHRVDTDARRPGALGRARRSSNSPGCGPEREGRKTPSPGISDGSFTHLPSPPPHFSRCVALHDMLVAAVVPSTKVVTDLFPLALQAIPREAKSPAPAPLRSRFAFGVSGPWPAAR